jgi:hypothetical protein
MSFATAQPSDGPAQYAATLHSTSAIVFPARISSKAKNTVMADMAITDVLWAIMAVLTRKLECVRQTCRTLQLRRLLVEIPRSLAGITCLADLAIHFRSSEIP